MTTLRSCQIMTAEFKAEVLRLMAQMTEVEKREADNKMVGSYDTIELQYKLVTNYYAYHGGKKPKAMTCPKAFVYHLGHSKVTDPMTVEKTATGVRRFTFFTLPVSSLIWLLLIFL